MLQQFKTIRYIKTRLVLHAGVEHPNTGIETINGKKSVRILAPNDSSYDTMPGTVPVQVRCFAGRAVLDPTRQKQPHPEENENKKKE